MDSKVLAAAFGAAELAQLGDGVDEQLDGLLVALEAVAALQLLEILDVGEQLFRRR